MKRFLSLFPAFAALAATPQLCAAIVTPNSYELVEGPTNISGPFQSPEITFQWLIAASEFSSLAPGTELTSIGFRLDADSTNQPASDADFTDWQLMLSPSVNAIGALSATFADNIASGAVTVRSGALHLDAASLTGGAGPNPFFFVPFSLPYAYSGGDLLVTLTHTGSANGFSGNDAVQIATVPGIADTVLQNSYNATTGTAHFYNVPITAFETGATVVPEPSTLLLAAVGLCLLGSIRRRPR